MIITAKDVYFLSDASTQYIYNDEDFVNRFSNLHFHDGNFADATKIYDREGIFCLWFDSYHKYFLAKQYYLQNKKPFQSGFDRQLDGKTPYLIMAPLSDFGDVDTWINWHNDD